MTQGRLSEKNNIIHIYLLTSYCWQRQIPWTCYSWARSCAPILHPPHTGCPLPHRGGGNRTWQPEQLQCQGSTETCTGPLPVWFGLVGKSVGFHCTLLHYPGCQGWEVYIFNVGSFIYKTQQCSKLPTTYTYIHIHNNPQDLPPLVMIEIFKPQVSRLSKKWDHLEQHNATICPISNWVLSYSKFQKCVLGLPWTQVKQPQHKPT